MPRPFSPYLIVWISVWGAIALLLAMGALFPPIVNLDRYHLDKLVHFTGTSALSFIPARHVNPKQLRYGMILSALLGSAGVEFAQPFFPPHMFSWADIATNSAGIGIGYIWGMKTRKNQSKLAHPHRSRLTRWLESPNFSHSSCNKSMREPTNSSNRGRHL